MTTDRGLRSCYRVCAMASSGWWARAFIENGPTMTASDWMGAGVSLVLILWVLYRCLGDGFDVVDRKPTAVGLDHAVRA